MNYKEAIETIKSNYPPTNYTMLREALDLAIRTFESKIAEEERAIFLRSLTSIEEIEQPCIDFSKVYK